LFQVPEFKEAVKTNAFVGKFTYQTFHLVGRVKACAPPGNLLTPPGGRRSSPVKNHWFKAVESIRRLTSMIATAWYF